MTQMSPAKFAWQARDSQLAPAIPIEEFYSISRWNHLLKYNYFTAKLFHTEIILFEHVF